MKYRYITQQIIPLHNIDGFNLKTTYYNPLNLSADNNNLNLYKKLYPDFYEDTTFINLEKHNISLHQYNFIKEAYIYLLKQRDEHNIYYKHIVEFLEINPYFIIDGSTQKNIFIEPDIINEMKQMKTTIITDESILSTLKIKMLEELKKMAPDELGNVDPTELFNKIFKENFKVNMWDLIWHKYVKHTLINDNKDKYPFKYNLMKLLASSDLGLYKWPRFYTEYLGIKCDPDMSSNSKFVYICSAHASTHPYEEKTDIDSYKQLYNEDNIPGYLEPKV